VAPLELRWAQGSVPLRQPRSQRIKPERFPWHTILGLILGLVGSLGVIQLRPQIVVLPQAPLRKAQPFSVPLRVDNSGYFSCPVEHIFVYVHRLKSRRVDFAKATVHQTNWNHFSLERAEGKTIMVKLADFAPDDVPSEADIAVVVDYRPFEHFPRSFLRYFRFVGAYGDNWQWLKQPSADIQADADQQIGIHMRSVPSSR